MNDDELIKQNSRDLRASIEFFSSKNKPERERWVCRNFLETLGVQFEEVELLVSSSDPPDVLFRDGKFEIKEILDAGRRRHQEYKVSLERALREIIGSYSTASSRSRCHGPTNGQFSSASFS